LHVQCCLYRVQNSPQ